MSNRTKLVLAWLFMYTGGWLVGMYRDDAWMWLLGTLFSVVGGGIVGHLWVMLGDRDDS